MCNLTTMLCVTKETKVPRGGDCTTTTQCETGNVCSQSVCCESDCTGLCKTCAGSGANRGLCRNVPNKTPEPGGRCGSECSPNKKDIVQLLCDANGACNAKGTTTDCGKDFECSAAMCVPKK
jgi:hypothetical protein